MNNLKPIDLQNTRLETRRSRGKTSRKIAIVLLALLIVSVMVVWFAFLGWGAVEMVRSSLGWLKKLWTALL